MDVSITVYFLQGQYADALERAYASFLAKVYCLEGSSKEKRKQNQFSKQGISKEIAKE